MHYLFKKYLANSSFDSIKKTKESNSASDYILRKKARATFCTSGSCPPRYNFNTQGELNLLRIAKYIDTINCHLPFAI